MNKKIFIILLLSLSIFSGCAATSSSSKDELAKSTPYEFKEVSSEKQVLVYDKTISLPDYVHSVQFSPTNENEIAVSLLENIDNLSSTNHYALVDLKTGKVKKDIKLNNDKEYPVEFNYLDDGKKIYLNSILEKVLKNVCQTNIKLDKDPKKDSIKKECQDTYVKQASRDKFAILDLQTGTVSPYSYNCDKLISTELKKGGMEAYCSTKRYGLVSSMKNLPINFSRYNYSKKYINGIAVYDKDSFKPKKIITGDGKLDTEFRIAVVSEDGQYVLFEKIIQYNNEQLKNKKYVVYDLKNEQIVHSFDAPFTIWGGGTFFIDKDTLVFGYNDDNVLRMYYKYMGIINLTTNEKKIFSDIDKGRSPSSVDEIYSLNNRYIMWKKYSMYYIFDIKDMKIVQEFKNTTRYAVSKKFKKVAFITVNNKLHIYNIAQGE